MKQRLEALFTGKSLQRIPAKQNSSSEPKQQNVDNSITGSPEGSRPEKRRTADEDNISENQGSAKKSKTEGTDAKSP